MDHRHFSIHTISGKEVGHATVNDQGEKLEICVLGKFLLAPEPECMPGACPDAEREAS